MEVRRQITLCFIICCCVNIIYTEDLADGNHASRTYPSEESKNLTKLKTGELSGKIKAHNKDGVNLELNIKTKVFRNDNKSTDRNTCPMAVMQKGEKGTKGDDGLPGPVGLKGENGDKGVAASQGAKGETGKFGDKGDIGPPGSDGKKGERGKDGINGQKGDQGKTGSCSDTMNINKAKRYDYGKSSNPAYSCNVLGKNGKYYLNPENGFEMLCQNNETCIQEPLSNNFNKLGIKKAVWLSNKLNLKEFYSLKLSQLSYLMSSTEGFHLTLEYSKKVKILEILCWNGVTLENLDENKNNGWKVTKEEKEMQTLLHLQCEPANYLPMNFRIETEIEDVSIKLKSLCFI